MTDDIPADDRSLGDARAWLRGRVDDGQSCPCCGQMAKVYRRKLTASIGRVLILMWHNNRDDWVYLPGIRSKGQDEAIARFWFLIERDPAAVREDGSKRTGWWRLTTLGVAFIHNEVKMPMYARIYDNRLLGLDAVQSVSIIDVLGTKFDYTELMEGT